MNQNDILRQIKQNKQKLKDKYHLSRIGFFGSFARDNATENSDVDIVVEMPPNLFMMVHLKEELQEILHRKVDIIRYRENMNAFLKERIDKETVYV